MSDELTRLVFFLIVLTGAATLAAAGIHIIADNPSHPQPVTSSNIADNACTRYCEASCMATPQPCLNSCLASCNCC